MDSTGYWKKCNSCKKPIGFKAEYWVCNVSTCNRVRTGLFFCSVSCWDAHLPLMNHREAWAEERRSPSEEEWKRIQSGEGEAAPRKREAKKQDPASEAKPAAPSAAAQGAPKVILRRKSGE